MIDVKLNDWKIHLERRRAIRNQVEKYKRLDMSERICDFPDDFFQKFISCITQEDLITYPSHARYDQLIDKISDVEEVHVNQIHLVPGSDVAIRLIFELACCRKSEVISTNPSFPMYDVYAKMFDSKIISVDYGKDLKTNTSDFLSKLSPKTRLVIISNPSNPVGDWKSVDEIEVLCHELQKRKILLCIDEAYVDYGPGTCKSLVENYQNIIITRTFSKGLGAAGIRVGYVISNSAIIDAMSRLRFTFPITNISTKFAIHLLEHSKIYQTYTRETIKERDYLAKKFKHAGFDVVNSHCNWIHFNDHCDNQRAVKILHDYDISLKAGTVIPFDPRSNWVRLTVGPGLAETEFIKEVLES